MITKNNKNFLIGIVGLFFLAMVAFAFMGTEDESVENQIEIEVSKEVDIEKIKEFEINIVNRKMTLDPPLISVEVGDQVLLNIKSDENLRFHIHEYDHEKMLMADEVKVLSFPATLPGRFDIEIHSGEDGMGDMDMGDMNMDLSNAKISIESVMVMDNMATVSVEIEGVEFPSKGIHWHIKLDEEITDDDHSALMVFGEKSYILKSITKGEHTVYVSLSVPGFNAEHKLIGNQASQTFVIESMMEPGMDMEEEHGHEEEEKAILIGFLEVIPKA